MNIYLQAHASGGSITSMGDGIAQSTALRRFPHYASPRGPI